MAKRRFLSPVGTSEERLSGAIWPGAWFDATGYGRNTTPQYTLGYHTGSDLNLNVPRFNADDGAPFYAVGPGTVVYARIGPGTWGLLILVDHGLVDGVRTYTRYAHGKNLAVKVGQQVDEWTRLCDISDAEGQFAAHGHFDVCVTPLFETQPWHWPGWNLALLEANYRDPKEWLKQEHEVEGDDMPDNLLVAAPNGLTLLDEPPVAAGTSVIADETAIRGTAVYRQVTVGERTGWMLAQDGTTKYLIASLETRQMRVLGDGLRRRNGPGTNFAIVTPSYSANTILTVTGTVPGQGSTKGWTQVVENGLTTGLWVSLDFLAPN